MTQTSQPWDGVAVGDAALRAPYSATEWDDMYSDLFGSKGNIGVIPGIGNHLEVTGAATPLSINTGAAMVLGKWYENDAAVSLAVPNPAAATRVDWVVLQCDWDGSGQWGLPQTIRIALHQGVEGAGTPPALTQVDGTLWEIPLATITVAFPGFAITVSDARQYLPGPGIRKFFTPWELYTYTANNPTWDSNNGAWAFTNGANREYLSCYWKVPSWYRQTDFRVWYYFFGSAAPAGNNQVVWYFNGKRSVLGLDVVGADFGFKETGTIRAVQTQLSVLNLQTADGAMPQWPPRTSIAAGNLCFFSISRDPTDGADNYAGNALLAGVEIAAG